MIGGIAVIGLAAVAIVYLLVFRNRGQKNAGAVGGMGQQPPSHLQVQQPPVVDMYQQYPPSQGYYPQKPPDNFSPPQGYAELGGTPAAPEGLVEMPAGK